MSDSRSNHPLWVILQGQILRFCHFVPLFLLKQMPSNRSGATVGGRRQRCARPVASVSARAAGGAATGTGCRQPWPRPTPRVCGAMRVPRRPWCRRAQPRMTARPTGGTPDCRRRSANLVASQPRDCRRTRASGPADATHDRSRRGHGRHLARVAAGLDRRFYSWYKMSRAPARRSCHRQMTHLCQTRSKNDNLKEI